MQPERATRGIKLVVFDQTCTFILSISSLISEHPPFFL